MTSGPITSWQVDGEKVETVKDFVLTGSKITVDCYFTREINKHLLLGRKPMTILDNIKKQRHHLTDKGP